MRLTRRHPDLAPGSWYLRVPLAYSSVHSWEIRKLSFALNGNTRSNRFTDSMTVNYSEISNLLNLLASASSAYNLVGDANAAVVQDRERWVPCNLPRKPVRIREVT